MTTRASALRSRVARHPVAPPREPQVVAEILSDGTIRRSDRTVQAKGTDGRNGWADGTISSDGWTIWWERRSWETPRT